MLGILGSLVAPVTEWIKSRGERKRIKQEAQAAVEKKMADLAASDSEFAWQWMLVKAQNEATTWKDEYALLVVTLPFVILMLAGAAAAFGLPVDPGALATALFSPLGNVPEWWTNTFQVGIWTALGVNQVQKLFGKK
jgi:hypothetical protein